MVCETKVKAALELYSYTYPTMELVRKFEEHAADQGRREGFQRKKGFQSIELAYPNPKCSGTMSIQ